VLGLTVLVLSGTTGSGVAGLGVLEDGSSSTDTFGVGWGMVVSGCMLPFGCSSTGSLPEVSGIEVLPSGLSLFAGACCVVPVFGSIFSMNLVRSKTPPMAERLMKNKMIAKSRKAIQKRHPIPVESFCFFVGFRLGATKR